MLSRMLRAGIFVGLVILALPAIAYAQYTSPNFEVDEIFIGGGGELEACSDNFCSDQSVGGTGGSTGSDNFNSEGGFLTEGEPSISMQVTNNAIDLGVLNTSTTAAASSNFSVSSYLTDGYIVRVYGDTPTNTTGPGTHSLTALNSPSLSQPGTEQFGINLVTNSTPGIGASPVQQPDSSFAYGEPAPGYDTADYFKYVDEDVIAQSDQATGQTDYTVSIIANVATSTPGGQYKTTLVLQVIATF